MGLLKGQIEYRKWKEGKRLTRKDAIQANCFLCNGQEDSRVDCRGEKSCPLYQYHTYKDLP